MRASDFWSESTMSKNWLNFCCLNKRKVSLKWHLLSEIENIWKEGTLYKKWLNNSCLNKYNIHLSDYS